MADYDEIVWRSESLSYHSFNKRMEPWEVVSSTVGPPAPTTPSRCDSELVPSWIPCCAKTLWRARGRRPLAGMRNVMPPIAGYPAETSRAVYTVTVREITGYARQDFVRRCSDYWDMAAFLKQLGHQLA
jgi:hypothetical protein